MQVGLTSMQRNQARTMPPEQLPESGLKNIKSYYVAQHGVARAFENKRATLFMLEWAELKMVFLLRALL